MPLKGYKHTAKTRQIMSSKKKGKPPGNMLPYGEAAKRALFSRMKASAKTRNLMFTLTFEEFLVFTSECCEYCGERPKQKCQPKEANGYYLYNGLDRQDNTKGYVPGNIVPCCGTCNYAKADRSVKDFLAWAIKIARLSGR